MKVKWVDVECPRCHQQCKLPIQYTGNKWPIDDAKCSRCFQDNVFVNFVRTVPAPEEALEGETK